MQQIYPPRVFATVIRMSIVSCTCSSAAETFMAGGRSYEARHSLHNVLKMLQTSIHVGVASARGLGRVAVERVADGVGALPLAIESYYCHAALTKPSSECLDVSVVLDLRRFTFHQSRWTSARCSVSSVRHYVTPHSARSSTDRSE
jgi:hypothetical protein